MRQGNLPYLAKLEEDPYSKALLDEVSDLLEKANSILQIKILEIPTNNVYYLHGYIKGMSEILSIAEEAREELTAFPEEA
jgi:hypothetical protein